jgi:threonine synthase
VADEFLRYCDSRGLDASRPTFSEVIISGIAEGGGLYVPESLPRFTPDEITALAGRPYADRALTIFSRFGLDLPAERLAPLLKEAYGPDFDDPAIAPVREVGDGRWILELWHGPTLAFKDMALQCLPRLFAEAVQARQAGGDSDRTEHLVLVATSGDTGTAALAGFAGMPGIRIAVFYPAEGVSDTQRLQMVTRGGSNVLVCGVRGNFDDCQNGVKATFSDTGFNSDLRTAHRLELSSANSINWGRLLPQIAYYASAYADIVAAGGVVPGAPVDICVPTGNFGNILAAWYARRLGVPIAHLLCASNENSVLTDLLATGVYDITSRPLVPTPSPSMDILISSNVERLLFELTRDPERIRSWAAALRETGRFELDEATFSGLKQVFRGESVSSDDCLATIGRVQAETGYLIDPHTAVAWAVAERLGSRQPVLIVSTAHWAKFGADVWRGLSGLRAAAPLPPELASGSVPEILKAVLELAPGQKVPPALADLTEREIRFPGIIESSPAAIQTALLDWLG